VRSRHQSRSLPLRRCLLRSLPSSRGSIPCDLIMAAIHRTEGGDERGTKDMVSSPFESRESATQWVRAGRPKASGGTDLPPSGQTPPRQSSRRERAPQASRQVCPPLPPLLFSFLQRSSSSVSPSPPPAVVVVAAGWLAPTFGQWPMASRPTRCPRLGPSRARLAGRRPRSAPPARRWRSHPATSWRARAHLP
jgi:hypothetical protein